MFYLNNILNDLNTVIFFRNGVLLNMNLNFSVYRYFIVNNIFISVYFLKVRIFKLILKS